MRKPDFFVVGAAKSGTSALWKYFQMHPDIFVTKEIASKELGYYSNQYGIDNEDQYLSHFKDATPNQSIGEVCHVYLTSLESAKRIKEEIPNAKIIIILRNPVDRAYSLYNWMVMHGYECNTSFEKALKREEELISNKTLKSTLLHDYKLNYSYFKSGLYYEQIKRFFDVFGRKNVLVIEYGDFKKNQKDFLSKIYTFLGVTNNHHFELNHINKSKRVISVKLQYMSRKLLLSKFSKYTFLKLTSNFLLKFNTINFLPKKINSDTRENLLQKYKEDIEKLTSLTRIDFNKKWF